MEYIIGTRGSKLALVQANFVCDTLQTAYPEHSFSIQIIKTKGDLIQNKPLNQIGDKGLFVKEIEEKILSGEVHIGVHSMKDMPTEMDPRLVFTKAWKREDPRDVLILREKKSIWDLPYGAVIGTGSKRREYQLKQLRNDLQVVDIRGNVDTRLRKMKEQQLDGIVLAAAGLHRLGMKEVITQYFESSEMISAPAQGILALQIKAENETLQEMLDALSDDNTENIAKAERGFLELIQGSCHVPIGAVCKADTKGQYEMQVMFGEEDGTNLAFATVSGTNPLELAKQAVHAIQSQMQAKKKVYLLGAGPGDPKLITVKGLEVLRQADCIIYDRLVAPELLAEAKPECECIYVGKASHNHTMKQEEINALLVEKGKQHAITVRLKGGDPFVFGRGGEEGIVLREQGIAFEVVPGISSCIAGLSYAGIPITHRGVATGFHVVTAHNQRDELADIDFHAMAKGTDTCVFLMGLSKVGEIARNLMEAGMKKETKVAVISKATTLEQQTCVSTLEGIEQALEADSLLSPALIVVGEVVGLREQLNFFEEQPLHGKRFLLPKIGEAKTTLSSFIEALGGCVKEVMVGEIRYSSVPFVKKELQQVDWIIFTSKNGVQAFFHNLKQQKMDLRCLACSKLAVIGEKTARELEKFGLYPEVMPQEAHSDGLVQVLKEKVKKQDTVWYVKAKQAPDHMKEKLQNMCNLKEIVLYENHGLELKATEIQNQYDGIVFTCASSAKRFFSHYEMEDIPIYSIGPKTTEALSKLGATGIIQSSVSTYENLVKTIQKQVAFEKTK